MAAKSGYSEEGKKHTDWITDFAQKTARASIFLFLLGGICGDVITTLELFLCLFFIGHVDVFFSFKCSGLQFDR